MDKPDNWFRAKFSPDLFLDVRIRDKLFSKKSSFQQIDIYDSCAFGRMLVLDNVINVTERDEFIYHEMLAHTALFSQNNAEEVLIIGGGDGGTVRESLKHSSVKHIHLVEIDEGVVEASLKFLPLVSSGLNDSRVKKVFEDASVYVKTCNKKFDVIIIDSTDPEGAGTVLYSRDFYQDCFNLLHDGGVLTAQSESPFFDPMIVDSLYKTAKSVFPIVKMFTAYVPSYVSGLWSFMFCSKTVDPVAGYTPESAAESSMSLQYYSQDIHIASFTLPPHIKREFGL